MCSRVWFKKKLPKSCLAGWSVQTICTHDLNRQFCRGGIPQDEPNGNSPMNYQGSRDICWETQKDGVYDPQGVRSGDLRPLLRQLNSSHQGAAPHGAELLTTVPSEALACWTKQFVLLPTGSGGSAL